VGLQTLCDITKKKENGNREHKIARKGNPQVTRETFRFFLAEKQRGEKKDAPN